MNSAATLHSVMVSRMAVNGSERLRGARRRCQDAKSPKWGGGWGEQGGSPVQALWQEDLENLGTEMRGGETAGVARMSDCVTLTASPPPPSSFSSSSFSHQFSDSGGQTCRIIRTEQRSDVTQPWSASVHTQVRASVQVRAQESDLPGSVAAAETQIT